MDQNFILKDKFVFVVSGTHGKTTTTSMLIKILKKMVTTHLIY